MISLVKKIFGTANERMLKSLRPKVAEIGALEPVMQALSAEALRAKTDEFRKRLADGETLDDVLVDAPAEREERPQACAHLADECAPDEQLVADRLRVGRGLAQGRQEES